MIHEFQDKLQKPETADKAKIWFPKANTIAKYTAHIFDYLDELKTRQTLSREETKKLYDELNKFKSDILLDSFINNVFEKNILLITNGFDTTMNQPDNFYKFFFKNTSHETFLSVINKLQNNIKIIENRMVDFCIKHVGCLDCGGFQDSFAALAVANKNYLKPGEFIEITAGVGSFSTKVQPEFVINGQIVKIDNGDGAAHYKMKVPLKAGDYYASVKIKYTDQNGTKQEVSRNIEYTVAKECDQ